MYRTIAIILVFIGLMVCPSAYADLREGLVAAWTFDDGTARDATGSGHDGELIGKPKAVKGKFGLGFDFNGVDTGVEIQDHEDLQLIQPFTVSAWIYIRSIQNHAGIVWKGSMIGWGTDVYNYRIALQGADPRDGTDGGLTWGACTGPVEGYFATGGVLPADELNKWHNVALVEDGTKGIAYLDGKSRLSVSDGDANRPSAPYAPLEGHPVRIGFAMGVSGNIADEAYVDGIIDEVLLYNRPMDKGEIHDLMDMGPNLAIESVGKLATTWSRIKSE
jgi:hypothetical protein